MGRGGYAINQAKNIHPVGICVVDCFKPSNLLFLGNNASSSTSSSTNRISRVFAAHDTLHDFTEEGDALSVGNNGAVWVVVSRVELYSFTSKFESLCQGSPRRWSRPLGRLLGVSRGNYKTFWYNFLMLNRWGMRALPRGGASSVG